MKRHYSAQNRPAGRIIRGVTDAVRVEVIPLRLAVPVTDELVACPNCEGGVRLIRAPFTDTEVGISAGKTKVYASHVYGGAGSSGHRNRCPSSHGKAVL